MSLIGSQQVESRSADAVSSHHADSGRATRAQVETARPTVICTLGMHRSGTSLTSRLLNLLGVDLGPPGSMAPVGWDNPKGYWEQHPLVGLNDEILAHFGGGWNKPPVFPAGWSHDPALIGIRERARQVLNTTFAQNLMWGWKDPRTCLTLPFWQDLIGPMRYVVCLRNPSAVLASLNRRNAMEAEDAERLWLAHVEASLTGTKDQPRMFVLYEDIISNWVTEVRRLAAFIGHPERGEDPQVLASIGEFLDPELCHHRMSIADLAASPRISFAAKGLYVALRTAVGPLPAVEKRATPVVAEKTVNLLATSAREMIDRVSAAVAAGEALTTTNEGLFDRLGEMRAEQERMTAGAAALTSQRDAMALELELRAAAIAALRLERNQIDAVVADLTGEITERASEAAELAADLTRQAAKNEALQEDCRALAVERDRATREGDAARHLLEEVYTSTAWRLITIFRHLIGRLLPAGSSRRRLYTAFVRRLAG